jgi:Ca-activated chloride channel family protein
MKRSMQTLAVWLAGVLLAGGAAAQIADVNVHVRAVPPSAVYSARAIPAHIIVPQARSFVADRALQKIEVTQVVVGVVILEQTATTTMDIDLRNPSPGRIEAELVLPLPEGAAVRSFTFHGAAAEPTAELLAKDAALGTYKSIVARMRDPAILEFAGCNLVRSSVFPIEAGGTQKIRLTYEHLLTADAERVDYVLPRTEAIDYKVPWEVAVKIKSKRPISTVFSPSHKIEFQRADPHVAMVRLGRAAMNEPGPLRLSYLCDGAERVTASLLAYPDAKIGGGYFLLLAGLPAAKPAQGDEPLKREVTVVIDRSGSMTGAKIKQAQAAALQVIEGLEDGEALNIIDFSDYLSSLAPKPLLKNKQTMEQARHYIRRLAAGGCTNIHDALAEALRPPPSEGMLPIVLFLTDGLPTVGIRDEATIRAAAQRMNVYKRRIFTFGVGYDVNAPLLTHLAQNSRAASTFVLPNEDIEAKVSQIYRRLVGPVVSDAELKVLGGEKGPAGARVMDLMPGILPDLFEGDQLVVLGKYQGDQPLRFRLTGRYRGKPRNFAFTFSLEQATLKNSFVPRLWASRKIAMLEDEIRQAGADAQPALVSAQAAGDPRMKELVDEIVRLSTDFGILTEYTAFLDRQGTNLNAANDVLRQATQNYVNWAQNTRSGMGAVSQLMNANAQQGQFTLNGRNAYVDQNMNRVETARVQQVNNGAMFQRGNTWIDSAAIHSRSGPRPDETVTVGSPEFSRLVDRLLAEERQGVLAVSGEILLRVDGKNVLIKRNDPAR